jgi:hypothetical protein
VPLPHGAHARAAGADEEPGPQGAQRDAATVDAYVPAAQAAQAPADAPPSAEAYLPAGQAEQADADSDSAKVPAPHGAQPAAALSPAAIAAGGQLGQVSAGPAENFPAGPAENFPAAQGAQGAPAAGVERPGWHAAQSARDDAPAGEKLPMLQTVQAVADSALA